MLFLKKMIGNDVKKTKKLTEIKVFKQNILHLTKSDKSL